MEESGLSDLFETAYGVNAVAHTMVGKAVSRALLREVLTESALITRIIESGQVVEAYDEGRGFVI